MADQAWIDQASMLVVSEGPALTRIDQASMLVVWGDLGGNTQIDQASMLVVSEGPALTRIDQASILAVWAESVPGSGDTSRRLAGDSIQGGSTATWAGNSIKVVGDA
jgi:hypothetical protein